MSTEDANPLVIVVMVKFIPLRGDKTGVKKSHI